MLGPLTQAYVLSDSDSGSCMILGRLPDRLRGKPGSGEYHIGICGGVENPRDTTDICLADIPSNGDALEDPSGWCHNRGKWYVLYPPHCGWSTTNALQHASNSVAEAPNNLPEGFDRGECGIRKRDEEVNVAP